MQKRINPFGRTGAPCRRLGSRISWYESQGKEMSPEGRGGEKIFCTNLGRKINQMDTKAMFLQLNHSQCSSMESTGSSTVIRRNVCAHSCHVHATSNRKILKPGIWKMVNWNVGCYENRQQATNKLNHCQKYLNCTCQTAFEINLLIYTTLPTTITYILSGIMLQMLPVLVV